MKKPPNEGVNHVEQNGSPSQNPREMSSYTLNARSKLYDLIVQFRQDAARLSDPKAKLLFEFSAEMLAGMARSFRNLEDDNADSF